VKTIILSAFGRFGIYTANSTEIVARQLNGKNIAGFKVCSVVFPCRIPKGTNRGHKLLRLAERIGARGIVSLGMASDKTGLCIEAVATNLINNQKYCPDLSGRAINIRDSLGKSVEIDLIPWNIGAFQQSCVEQGVLVMDCSRKAGGFCCEHLMYQLWRAQRVRQYKTPFIFIHVPCCREAIPDYDAFLKNGKVAMATESIIKGLEILLTSSAL